MFYEDAKELATSLGHGIGFVIRKEDKYFCIDIDNCVKPEGGWSDLAIQIMTLFVGCYMEVSNSNRGLHIIGKYEGEEPIHGCKDTSKGLELYTDRRFIALAEISPQGSFDAIHTGALNQFIKDYFPRVYDSNPQSEDWTTESHPDCNPPEDNLELIEFILNRKPTAQETFGSTVSFRDLFEANEEVLSKAYPPINQDHTYNRSDADAALIYRLHYWLGGNCERIEQIMRLSKLYYPDREAKWDGYENYLPNSIMNSKGRHKKCFAHSHRQSNNNATGNINQQEVGALLNIEQQIAYFQNCTYIAETHLMLIPEGVLYKPEAFNSMYGGASFHLDFNNEKVTRKAFEAFTLSQGYSFPKVHATCFKPLLGFGEIITENDSRFVNIYRPVNPPRNKQDVERFITHVTHLLPHDEDRLILLSYMAALIQYKGIKFTWCVIVQGVEGNGKSFLNEVLAYCIGRQYVHSPKSSDLTGKFNGWMENKLLITVDDIYQSSWDMLEILKPMITNRHQEIERKGIDKVTREVFCNFILNTNHQDGIRKTKNDRRFAPLFTAQQEPEDIIRSGMGGDYFPQLFRWFNDEGGAAAINEYLSTFEIPDKYNPTTSCIRAPMTSSTELAIAQSLDPIAQRIKEWIGESIIGFKNGWLSSMMINRKLLDHNVKVNPKQLPLILKSLGYVPHPGLDKGRASRTIKLDGGQSKLYIHLSHVTTLGFMPMSIVDAYENDQK
jgi:hypothetical protein